MWKLTSQGFRKCGTFWACELSNGSYCCSKSAEGSKSGCVPVNRQCKKKKRPQFWFFRSETNSTAFQLCEEAVLFVSELKKIKLWPCLFFVTLPIFGDAHTFAALCWLWATITPVRKLARPKSTTFSESLGRELSHGPIRQNFLPHENVEEKGF